MSNSINVVQHNLLAMFSDRQLGIVTNNKAKSSEKLSSGYRINRAADDAAGLSISEKMRRQIRGLTQASKNIQDGVSLCQVADGYLDEVDDMLHRVNELAVKGANDTLQQTDRDYIDQEVQALKEEMARIFETANFNEIPLFHTSYVPSLKIPDEVTDILVFHGDTTSGAGGLAFDNIRYSIGELQAKGMQIDDNGYATSDFEEWTFYTPTKDVNGRDASERVALTMEKGDSLNAVVRNYNWQADDEGIKVNEVLAVTWETLFADSASDKNGTIYAGDYSFDWHGMQISFTADQDTTLDGMQTQINGDGFGKHANWDVSIGGGEAKAIAPISQALDRTVTPPAVQSVVEVSEANKQFVDHEYGIRATESGLSIRDMSDPARNYENETLMTWDRFVDFSGNDLNITDWGTRSETTDSRTFDEDSAYRYTSPDTRMEIRYDFQLGEAMSRTEVIDEMNRKTFTNVVSAPGTISFKSGSSTAGSMSASDGSVLRIVNNYLGGTNSAFRTQRALGRDFDQAEQKLEGTIQWTRTETAGDPGIDAHTVAGKTFGQGSPDGDARSTTRGAVYYKVEQSDGTFTYYKSVATDWEQDFDASWTERQTWQQTASYKYAGGSLNGKDMIETTADGVKENFEGTYDCTGKGTAKWTTYALEAMTEEEVTAAGGTVNGAIQVPASGLPQSGNFDEAMRKTTLNGTLSDVSKQLEEGSDKIYSMVSSTASRTVGFQFKDGSGSVWTAFTFTHTITADAAESLRSGSTASIGIEFETKAKATRNFVPVGENLSAEEGDFTRVKVNPPKKELKIQSGTEKDHQITLEWSPLNNSIIGIAGTNTRTRSASLSAIDDVKGAMELVNETRSDFGAYQNRLEHAIRLTDNVVENTQRAESLIRDTDMSEEMVRFSNANILAQAGQAMLTQANQTKQGILSMLG